MSCFIYNDREKEIDKHNIKLVNHRMNRKKCSFILALDISYVKQSHKVPRRARTTGSLGGRGEGDGERGRGSREGEAEGTGSTGEGGRGVGWGDSKLFSNRKVFLRRN